MKNLLTALIFICLNFAPLAQANVASTLAKQTNTPSPVAWEIPPKFEIFTEEFNEITSPQINVAFFTDTSGHIVKTQILRSSGSSQVDQKILRSMQYAKFFPYIENGVAIPFYATQPFLLTSTYSIPPKSCPYRFDSNIWLNQINTLPPKSFFYLNRPSLLIQHNQLQGKDRTITFQFKIFKEQRMTDIKITQSSGLAVLDQTLLNALLSDRVQVAPQIEKNTDKIHEDTIHFKFSTCTKMSRLIREIF